MEFNLDKSEVMHFGRSNSVANYTINGRNFKSIDIQRDLGIQVHTSLQVATQTDKVVKKAHSIEYKSWQVMYKLYKTLVKPHLKYCMQFWLPHYQKDVDTLETVQTRFIRVSEE
eukprot:g46281.t1